MTFIDLLREILNLGPFKPGFYLYLGRYELDRSLFVVGWRGPFKSRTGALENVSSDWGALGLDIPKVSFRLFQPYECKEPLEEKWTVKSRKNNL